MLRGVRTMLLAATAALSIAPASAAAAEECGEIVLGAALSLSGPDAAHGRHARDGYEFTIGKIRDAGGVRIDGACYNFRVVYYDDESIPARTAQLAERLITTDEVRFMLGPYGSGPTMAAAPVTEKHRVPLIASQGAVEALFDKGYSHLFAVLSPAGHYMVPVLSLAGDLAERGGRERADARIAVAAREDPFSRDLRDAVLEHADREGMRIVADEALPTDADDLSEALDRMTSLRPDLLIVAGRGTDAAAAVRQAGDAGLDVPLLAIPNCDAAALLTHLADASEGVLCPAQWDTALDYRDSLHGSAGHYAKEVKAAIPRYDDVPYEVAQASAAVLVLKDAIERAGTVERGPVREALAATDLETFYGPVKFAPEGYNSAKPIVLRQIQGRTYVTVAPGHLADGQVLPLRELY